jgi:hypothetical protein
LPSGIKPLQQLEQKNHLDKIRQAQTALGKENASLPDEVTLTKAVFISHLAGALRRRLESFHPHELQEVDQAWQQYGPFLSGTMHIALARAILEKGVEQHISFYLDAIIQSHLKHLDNSKSKES